MRPGLGWLPDLPDPRDQPFSKLALPFAKAPSSASLGKWLGTLILDQSITSSCVWHAIAYAVFVCHRKGGAAAPPLLSRLFGYFNTRVRHGSQDVDGGTYIREGIKSLAALGFCPESLWPFDPGNVNTRPDWDAYQGASDRKMPVGYYRIDGHGSVRVDQVRAAIAAGDPVILGTEIGQDFVDDTEGLIFGPPSTSVGGHAMCLLEYDATGFRGPQSWGMTRDGVDHPDGWFAMDAEYIASEVTRDLWAFRTVPAFT